MHPSTRGEYEITDAINGLISDNKKVMNHICSKFIDSGTPKGLKTTFEYIFENRHNNCCLSKQKLYESKLINPIHMGKNFQIGNNSIVGPMTSIGNNVKIGNKVFLKNSIVLNNTNIESNQKFSNCVISDHGIFSFN